MIIQISRHYKSYKLAFAIILGMMPTLCIRAQSAFNMLGTFSLSSTNNAYGSLGV